MADGASGEAREYNTEIITEFGANLGRVGGVWTGTTLILIHHMSARSGIERVTPVACSPQGEAEGSDGWPDDPPRDCADRPGQA